MRLDLDSEIRFANGERAGFLRKVVLDPNNDVSQVVMSIDELISRDVIVPVSMLSEGPGGDININCTPDEWEDLTEYTEERVPVIADGWEMNENITPMGEVFPGTTYEPIVPIVEVPNIPEGSVSLDEGTEIWCIDERWGVVDEVLTNENGHTQAFVGRPDNPEGEPDGLILKRLIPIQLAQEIDATRVVLNCSISDLPQYTEEVSGVVDE